MPEHAPLGEFEVIVVMAVMHLADAAYGSAIRDEIELRTGRAAARGAVYITLDRLEEKGLLTSKVGDGAESRAGRPRRLFHVTPSGVRSVRHAVSMLSRMHRGLEPLLGDL